MLSQPTALVTVEWPYVEMLIRLTLSLVLGLLIGLERERRGNGVQPVVRAVDTQRQSGAQARAVDAGGLAGIVVTDTLQPTLAHWMEMVRVNP